MGKKSIASKAASRDQRFRMIKMKINKMFENKGEIKEVTMDEVKCSNCGFKARYQFVRCPQCDELHKS